MPNSPSDKGPARVQYINPNGDLPLQVQDLEHNSFFAAFIERCPVAMTIRSGGVVRISKLVFGRLSIRHDREYRHFTLGCPPHLTIICVCHSGVHDVFLDNFIDGSGARA